MIIEYESDRRQQQGVVGGWQRNGEREEKGLRQELLDTHVIRGHVKFFKVNCNGILNFKFIMAVIYGRFDFNAGYSE